MTDPIHSEATEGEKRLPTKPDSRLANVLPEPSFREVMLPRRWPRVPLTRTQKRVVWLEHKVKGLEADVNALLMEAYKRD